MSEFCKLDLFPPPHRNAFNFNKSCIIKLWPKMVHCCHIKAKGYPIISWSSFWFTRPCGWWLLSHLAARFPHRRNATPQAYRFSIAILMENVHGSFISLFHRLQLRLALLHPRGWIGFIFSLFYQQEAYFTATLWNLILRGCFLRTLQS